MSDDFPTPPWATRALLKYVVQIPRKSVVLEPADGRGYMSAVLEQAGMRVLRSDIFPYESRHPSIKIQDYLLSRRSPRHDFVITNPPYALVDKFLARAIREADRGVGMLIQTLYLTGVHRYEVLKQYPPAKVAVFTRKMSATRGKLIRKGSNMMSHSWFWWDKSDTSGKTELLLIPPTAQRELELESDYT